MLDLIKATTDHLTLLVGDRHGVYIPQIFIDNYEEEVTSFVSKEDIETLKAGPDNNEGYWDAWDTVTSNCSWEHQEETWYLHQDGDLWMKKIIYPMDRVSALTYVIRQLHRADNVKYEYVKQWLEKGLISLLAYMHIGIENGWIENYEGDKDTWFTTCDPGFDYIEKEIDW